MQQAVESSIFGLNKVDANQFVVNDDEDEEPKAVVPDRFQQNRIKFNDRENPKIRIIFNNKRSSTRVSSARGLRRQTLLYRNSSFLEDSDKDRRSSKNLMDRNEDLFSKSYNNLNMRRQSTSSFLIQNANASPDRQSEEINNSQKLKNIKR